MSSWNTNHIKRNLNYVIPSSDSKNFYYESMFFQIIYIILYSKHLAYL